MAKFVLWGCVQVAVFLLLLFYDFIYYSLSHFGAHAMSVLFRL